MESSPRRALSRGFGGQHSSHHRGEKQNWSLRSMPMSRTGFTRSTIFVKMTSKLFSYRPRLHGAVNQRFREVPICSRQVAYRRIDHPYVRVSQAVGCHRVEHECFLSWQTEQTASRHAPAAKHDFLRQCGCLLVVLRSHSPLGIVIAFSHSARRCR